MRVAILATGADTNGTAARIAAAFRHWYPTWEVRALAGHGTYADHPRDLGWSEPDVLDRYAAADVVQFQNSAAPYARLDRDQRKPIVLAHHGVFLRETPERALALAAAIGARVTVSTVDLLAEAPGASWAPAPFELGELARIRRAAMADDASRGAGHRRIRIAHAPTSRKVKDTAAIVAALERLAAEYSIEFDLIEGVPWAECLARKARADIVVDQLALGPGSNAIEAWAMGIPVIVGFADPADVAIAEATWGALPFVNTPADVLVDRLAALIESAADREAEGARGLEHARRFHDDHLVADRLAELWSTTPRSLGAQALAGWSPPPARASAAQAPVARPLPRRPTSPPPGALPLMSTRRGRAGYRGDVAVYLPSAPGLPMARASRPTVAARDASRADPERQIWFVTPAWRRYELSAVCFEQRRRLIDELAGQGIEARCVVIADDENLDLARAAGFDVVERDNAWLGRRFNDGIEHAGRAGATWIVPIGSDSWIHADFFTEAPLEVDDPRSTRTSSLYSVVTDTRLAELRITTAAGVGPYVFHRDLLARSGFRPARDEIAHGVDGATVAGLSARPRWRPVDIDPLQYVGFRGRPHLTPYGRLWRTWGVRERTDPWEALAVIYPVDLVDQARRILQASPVATDDALPLAAGS